MKGVQFSILAVFWLVAMAMIVSASLGVPFFGAGKEDALVKTDIYMMDSATIAAQSYMAAALQYSNYQACYDLMKNGGRSKPAEGTYTTLPARDDFLKSLNSNILGNINAYAGMGYSFANKYVVDIQKYSSLNLTENASALSASALADGKMISSMAVLGGRLDEKGQNIKGEAKVMRDADIQWTLRLTCLSIFDKAKQASNDINQKILDLLRSETNSLQQGSLRDSAQECSTRLKDDAETRIKDAVAKFSDNIMTVEPLSVDLELQLHTPIEADQNGRFFCRFEKNGEPEASAKVTMKLQDKVPVWNGNEIKYENIEPVFRVDAKLYDTPVLAYPL